MKPPHTAAKKRPRRGSATSPRPPTRGPSGKETAAKPRRPQVVEHRRTSAARPLPGPRVAARALPGPWLWTLREGAEIDLCEELRRSLDMPGKPQRAVPEVVCPALVRSAEAPGGADGGIQLTFARTGFRIVGEMPAGGAATATRVAGLLLPLLRAACRSQGGWALDAWVPDATGSNPFADDVRALGEATLGALAALAPDLSASRLDLRQLRQSGGLVASLCLYPADGGAQRVFVGTLPSTDAPSLAPGGRSRVKVAGSRPSRAARKLEEAFAWLGLAPVGGEVCVDLGAAPGGWSWVVLERGARVIAIDPARLDAAVTTRRNSSHITMNAFHYDHERDAPNATGEPADWLLCDMAYRPLEVAALLAKWGRRRWARLLVANLKLPMKRKAEMVERLRSVVEEGGWRSVRTRQLYHDRDEITLVAHL